MMLLLWVVAVGLEPPFPCVDAKGVSVAWLEDDFIKDLAQAQFVSTPGVAGKRPAVQYNPNRMKRLTDKTQQFFLAHECGHHALGHLYSGIQGQDKEQAADCWAIHKLKADGLLGDGDLETIQRDLGDVARMDKNHSAGLLRAGNLVWCLKDPPPKSTIAPDPLPASEPVVAPVPPAKEKEEEIVSLALALLSCGVSLLGTVLALKLRAQMQWLTAFSSGLLVALAVVNLLPEAFALEHEAQASDSLHRLLLYIAGSGFLLFYTLDLMVPEHHAHGHEHHRHAPEVPRVVGLIGAGMLSLHRFLDGALISTASSHLLQAIGAAIIIHNFADGLSSASIMLRDGHSLRRTFLTSAVVAICPLLGWLLGGQLALSQTAISYALALFAGAFLYLGGSHLLIREDGQRLKYAPLAAAGGFLLIYLLQN